MTELTVHASCLLLGEHGVLIRGASGSGKSRLAVDLAAAARRDGVFTRLVADDRVRLAVAHGRIVARPHPALAGLVELRGQGIVPVPHEPACRVSLVIDREPDPPRLPDDVDGWVEIGGVTLPRFRVGPGDGVEPILLAAVVRMTRR